MNILSKLFKVTAARMPRVRGFGSRFYFGHWRSPFADAPGGYVTGPTWLGSSRVDLE